MTRSTIHLSADGLPPQVTIKVESTDGLFLSRLRGELDLHGTTDVLRVPAERFLLNRLVIQALCRQFDVSLTADKSAAILLTQAKSTRILLDSVLSGKPMLARQETLRRLAGSRFTRMLREFQVRDLGKLLAIPHGANFSVPGAGKTTVAYALYEAERTAERVDRLLVVAPISAFDAWITEGVECFRPAPSCWLFRPDRPIPSGTEVLVLNYSKLLNPDNFEVVVRWVGAGKAHVVLDEVHRIKKGRAGAWGARCLDLAWYAKRRDVLSGTPAPQHPSDVEAVVEFLWPGEARRVLPPVTFSPQPQPEVGRRLAEAMGPFFVRTRKSELGLEEPTFRVLHLELHGLHREIYLAMTNQYSGVIHSSQRNRTRLAEMRRVVMYLLEAATNPALLSLGSSPNDPPVFEHPRAPIPVGSDLIELLNKYGLYETPAKFRKLGELVRDSAAKGRKTLVWSNFVRNLELLERDLARYRPAIVHGGVPSEVSQPTAARTREMEIARFRTDPACGVLLANPAAMSEGLSLHQTCHDAVYLERTFNAGQYLQSVDRIHRLGLEAGVPTRVTFLVTRDTVDEIVHERVAEKSKRLGEILDDPDILTMALPDDDDLEDVTSGFGQPIDDDYDIARLFAHLRGEDGA